MAKYEEWLEDMGGDGWLRLAGDALSTVSPLSGVADGEMVVVTSGEADGMAVPVPSQFPVGFVVVTVANTNPAPALGYGTWASCGNLTNLIGGLLLTLYFWKRTV